MKTIILLTFLFCSIANAQEDQVVIDLGLGLNNSQGMRMLTVGAQADVFNALKQKWSVGGWIDNGNGKTGSPLLAGQLGFEVNSGGFVASVFSGPAIVFISDSLLGGAFQFMSDVHIGIQDRESNYIGAMYRHISSAGLESPNVGRDVLALEIKF